MPYHFFATRTLDPDAGQDALNRFCAANRVVSVERQFAVAGLDSHWAAFVTTTTGPGPITGARGRDNPSESCGHGTGRALRPGRTSVASLRAWSLRRSMPHNADRRNSCLFIGGCSADELLPLSCGTRSQALYGQYW